MPIVVNIEEPNLFEEPQRVIDGFQIRCTTCGSQKVAINDRRYSEPDMPPKVYGTVIVSCHECLETRILAQ